MSRKVNYNDICNRLAARQCYNGGQTITEIAASAKESRDTIRRWLRDTGLKTILEVRKP